jgi:type VI secretion system secreted protein Hcp
MAHQAFMTIKGQKQGQFKGQPIPHKDGDKWIEILAFQMGVQSPRDAASGLPSGKRQHQPLTITKERGAATPQIWQALWNNEILQSVELHFVRSGGTGQEAVYQTIHLTNATISHFENYSGPLPPSSPSGHGHENVTFQYEGQIVVGGGGPASLVGPIKRFGKWG